MPSPARLAMAQAALANQGVPDQIPTGVPVGAQGQMPDILAMLKGGQMSVEQLLQLIAMLGGMGGGGMPQMAGPEQGPIMSAMMGGQEGGGY